MGKKTISTILVLSLFMLSACGGRNPEPVMVKRYNDERKNCELLAYDIENIEFQIHKLLPKTDKLKQNVAYGLAGWFFLYVPWLLMDFKNAEALEYEALRERHAYLGSLAKKKGCSITPAEYPSLQEIKEEATVYKRLQPDYRAGDKDIEPPSRLEKMFERVEGKAEESAEAVEGSAKEGLGKVTPKTELFSGNE